jgi:hypothetical protein
MEILLLCEFASSLHPNVYVDRAGERDGDHRRGVPDTSGSIAAPGELQPACGAAARQEQAKWSQQLARFSEPILSHP